MYPAFLVGIGGAAGSILRFALQRWVNHSFPIGTFCVNIAGCFLIGIVWGLTSRGLGENTRLFLATGFCGGFTTFSAFSQESLQLLMDDRWAFFLFYVMGSVIIGLLATYFGFKLQIQ